MRWKELTLPGLRKVLGGGAGILERGMVRVAGNRLIRYRDLDWRYWVLTLLLLFLGLAGWKGAFRWVFALSLIQVLHFAARK